MTSTTFLLRDVEQITVYQLLPDLAVLKNFRWLSSCSGTVSMRGPCEHSLNFSRVFLYWVFPYLTQRQYFVQLDSNYSCFPSANYDFPQVSTIGPILFNLCVDDILSITPNNTLPENVCIRSYYGPCVPAFGLNTKRYSVSLRIQSECGKIQTRITPNTDTFYAVIILCSAQMIQPCIKVAK